MIEHRQNQLDGEAVFAHCFPAGIFIPLTPDYLSIRNRVHFELLGSNYTEFFAIAHGDGSTTLGGVARTPEAHTFHLVDRTPNFIKGVMLTQGYGKMLRRFGDTDPIWKDKPTVSELITRRVFREMGLATRRLKMMNALSRMYYGLPLYSNKYSTYAETNIWEKLVREGLAEKFQEGRDTRYRFQD